jgi:hypothetical protein
MLGERQEAPGQCGGRGDAQFAIAVTVAITPSQLTI